MYVFGIDMPIMELLFILFVLLVLGLIIILYEIRKLRKMILIEQSDIYKFEHNLKDMKPQEKKKHSLSLSGYIKKTSERGMKKNEVKDILMGKGWPEKMIEEIYSKLKI